MLLYTTTLFLPSPAVPYVRISLLLATCWKPLPSRHRCDTQAHQHYSRCSCSQGYFAKSGYSVLFYHCSYYPIRRSDRILPISVLNPYTVGLCHSMVVPDYLSDLPQFTLHFLLYMPSSIPRRAASLHLSVTSQSVTAFTQYVKARHPLLYPRHLPLVSQRTAFVTRLQCSLYATACRIVRPTEMTPSAFARVRVLLLPSFPVFGHPPTSRI